MEGGGPYGCALRCVGCRVSEGVRESLCTREDNHPFFSGSAVCGSIRGVLFGSTGLAVPKNCLYGAAQCLCSSLSP